MKWKKALPLHKIPSNFLNVQFALILLMGDILLGIIGFKAIERYSMIDAFYMTVITISTVGYTEVEPPSSPGKIFSSIYIIVNVAVFAYILAVFSYYVIQGEIFRKMHENNVKSRIEDLKDHIIICGYGKYGREIAHHFSMHQIPFVVIDWNQEKIEKLQKSEEDILYIQDDATHDETLLEAGVEKARSIIAAMPNDTDNVFTVLTARQLNPKINIISRAKEQKSEKKLLLAGANHVVMPEKLGGFYMATLVSKPGAVEFFSLLTMEYQSDISFEEMTYDELPSNWKGKSIMEMSIREEAGVNIIGYRSSGGKYVVNPAPSVILTPGSSFIILGDHQQLNSFKEYLQKHLKKDK